MKVDIVIPQIFFDVLGRVAPGIAVMLTAYLVFPGYAINAERMHNAMNWFHHEGGSTLITLLNITLLSYVLSTVLEGFWHLLEMLSPEPDTSNVRDADTEAAANQETPNQLRTTPGLRSDSKWAPWLKWIAKLRIIHRITESKLGMVRDKVLDGWKEVGNAPGSLPNDMAIMYDYIRLKQPEVGARLVKLRAESHAYRRLITGWGLCAILSTWNLFYLHNFGAVVAMLIVLALLFGAMLVYLRREAQWYWSVSNHWMLLQSMTGRL